MRWSVALLPLLCACVSAQIEWAGSISTIETVGDQVELAWRGGNGQQVTIYVARTSNSAQGATSSLQYLFDVYVGADTGSYTWTIPETLLVASDPDRAYELRLTQEGNDDSKPTGVFIVQAASSASSNSTGGTTSNAQTTAAPTSSPATTTTDGSPETTSDQTSESSSAGDDSTDSTSLDGAQASETGDVTSAAASATTTGDDAASSGSNEDSASSSTLSTGAIVGIVVGLLAVFVGAGLVGFLVWRRKHRKVVTDTSQHDYKYPELSSGDQDHTQRHELGRNEVGIRYEKDGISTMAEMPGNAPSDLRWSPDGKPPANAMYEMPGDARYR